MMMLNSVIFMLISIFYENREKSVDSVPGSTDLESLSKTVTSASVDTIEPLAFDLSSVTTIEELILPFGELIDRVMSGHIMG